LKGSWYGPVWSERHFAHRPGDPAIAQFCVLVPIQCSFSGYHAIVIWSELDRQWRRRSSIPVGTRQIVVQMQMTRGDGAYNDGYVDNLLLVLTSTIATTLPELRDKSPNPQVRKLARGAMRSAVVRSYAGPNVGLSTASSRARLRGG
jgi:hypothetical protein